MDTYWSDTQAFVSALQAEGPVYGPADMDLPGLRSYAALGASSPRSVYCERHRYAHDRDPDPN